MARGDTADMLGRIKGYLPKSWFGDASPVLDTLLNAIAAVNSFLYGLIQFAELQTRIKTATGGWLELVAADFFGPTLTRGVNQSDTLFRQQIIVNLFRPRATRQSIINVVTDLTGTAPTVFEPGRVQDTGGYSMPCMGYGVAGRYGSLELPYQAFVLAYRPAGSGIPNVAGYGYSVAGYSVPSQSEYASLSMVQDTVRDADIYAAIDSVKPVGTIMWVRIGNSFSQPTTPPNYSLLLQGGPIVFNGGNIRLPGWTA